MLILQNRGKSRCRDLAEELGVSRRTVLRDIDALSLSGIPVIAESGPGGGVFLDEDYRTGLTGLKAAELRALLLSTDGGLLSDIGLGDAVRSGRLKLEAAAPKRESEALAAFRGRILIDSRWWWHQEQDASILSSLQEAVFSDALVEADYDRYDGTRRKTRLEAYGLAAKSGLWYFIGRRDDGEFRTYRVSRLISVRRLPRNFRRDPDFNLEVWWPRNAERFAKEFSAYRFTLAVSADKLTELRLFAPGRVAELGPHSRREGWIEAEIGVDSENYAAMLVVLMGKHGRILSPASLATFVAALARELLETSSA
jgi:predicted DNA-binding transcriptional regulator YafY